MCRLGAVQNQGETGPRAGVSWCGVGGVLVSWGKGDVCSDILSDKDHLLSSTIRPHYRAVRPPASCLLAIPLLFSLFSSLFSSPLLSSPLLSLTVLKGLVSLHTFGTCVGLKHLRRLDLLRLWHPPARACVCFVSSFVL